MTDVQVLAETGFFTGPLCMPEDLMAEGLMKAAVELCLSAACVCMCVCVCARL